MLILPETKRKAPSMDGGGWTSIVREFDDVRNNDGSSKSRPDQVLRFPADGQSAYAVKLNLYFFDNAPGTGDHGIFTKIMVPVTNTAPPYGYFEAWGNAGVGGSIVQSPSPLSNAFPFVWAIAQGHPHLSFWGTFVTQFPGMFEFHWSQQSAFDNPALKTALRAGSSLEYRRVR